MPALKTLVVDDEKPARDRLIHLLSKDERVEVVGEAGNGVDAIDFVAAHQLHLVLLDIQMPGLDGFDVVRMVKKLPMVIFTTAFDKYAIKAFEVHALDYLLKPIPAKRLNVAIGRALAQIGQNAPGSDPDWRKRMLEAVDAISPTKAITRVPVRLGERIQLVEVTDVLWFYVQDKLVSLVTREGESDTHFTTINEIERKLDPDVFFRIHRSTVININHIREIRTWFHGTLKVVMDDEASTELDVSREHSRRLRKQLGW
ncbi:MAG: response regulator transcription factor [SAR324 cluster bacterium]|nr:response regulator transcription factor [SAR324 cluster bacterium]